MIYYAFLLFFILEYVRPGTYLPIVSALRLNSLVPLAVILGTTVMKGPVSNADVLRDTNARLILGFVSLILMSVLLADITMYTYTIFSAVAGYALVTWVIQRQIYDLRRLKGVFGVLVLVHLILAALTPQMFTDPDARHFLASGSFLGDGNDYALSVNVAIPFCMFLVLSARRMLPRLFLGGCLLMLVLCVVATKSRGGTVALACVAAYYWLKSDRKVLLSAIAVIAVAIVLVSAPPVYFQRMSTISSDPQDSSAQRRLEAWGSGVRMALDNPIFGVGAGQFPSKFGREYRPAGPLDTGRWMTAHSIYFLILGELGIPGISLLLVFIFSNLLANRRLMAEVRARAPDGGGTDLQLLASLSASVLAYATGGAFLSAAYYPHMFVIAGLSSAGRRLVRDRLASAVARAESTAPVVSTRREVVVRRLPQVARSFKRV